MFRWCGNLISMGKIVFKRLRDNLGIAISALIGIIAVLSMIVCVPVFSYAVSSEVLRQELEAKVATSHRYLFSVHAYFLDGRSASLLSVKKVDELTQIIRQDFTNTLGVKPFEIITEIQSGPLNFSSVTGENGASDIGLSDQPFRFLSNAKIPQVAQLVDGEWPTPDTSSDGPIKVAISEVMAYGLVMNVGDRYQITDNLEIEIAGIWKPTNPSDSTWFDAYDVSYSDKLWIPEDTYRARLENTIPQTIFYTTWYIIVNEKSLNYQHAPQYARGITRLGQELDRLLPGTTKDFFR
jgi:putative ABC transport system permease protein